MKGVVRFAFVFLFLFPIALFAQPRNAPPPEEQGTHLGVLVSPIPEVLYAHLSTLPRGEGVVVTRVLTDSPAANAGVRRHDLLLRLDSEPIRDSEQLVRLLNARKPEQKVSLTLLRSGKPIQVETILTLGSVLKLDSPESSESSKGTVKSGGPPPEVSVSATPLGGGRVKVTIEYYPEGLGRARAVTCDGTPDELASKVQDLELPMRVRELTRVALERIRDLDFETTRARPRK